MLPVDNPVSLSQFAEETIFSFHKYSWCFYWVSFGCACLYYFLIFNFILQFWTLSYVIIILLIIMHYIIFLKFRGITLLHFSLIIFMHGVLQLIMILRIDYFVISVNKRSEILINITLNVWMTFYSVKLLAKRFSK